MPLHDTASAQKDHPGPGLIARAEAIRLTMVEIAKRAELSKHTVATLRNPPPGLQTKSLFAVQRVIEREERDQLARLLALHPDVAVRAA